MDPGNARLCKGSAGAGKMQKLNGQNPPARCILLICIDVRRKENWSPGTVTQGEEAGHRTDSIRTCAGAGVESMGLPNTQAMLHGKTACINFLAGEKTASSSASSPAVRCSRKVHYGCSPLGHYPAQSSHATRILLRSQIDCMAAHWWSAGRDIFESATARKSRHRPRTAAQPGSPCRSFFTSPNNNLVEPGGPTSFLMVHRRHTEGVAPMARLELRYRPLGNQHGTIPYGCTPRSNACDRCSDPPAGGLIPTPAGCEVQRDHRPGRIARLSPQHFSAVWPPDIDLHGSCHLTNR